MTDTMIVYYSLDGNIDFLARSLAKETGADLCRLETVKVYPKKGLMKFFHGGKDAVAGIKPELKTALPDLTSYSKVVIAAPVWAGKPAAPINTFMDKADFRGKKIFAITSSASGNGSKTLELLVKEAEKKGGNPAACESFKNPCAKPDEALEKIKAFAKKVQEF